MFYKLNLGKYNNFMYVQVFMIWFFSSPFLSDGNGSFSTECLMPSRNETSFCYLEHLSPLSVCFLKTVHQFLHFKILLACLTHLPELHQPFSLFYKERNLSSHLVTKTTRSWIGGILSRSRAKALEEPALFASSVVCFQNDCSKV